MSLEQSIADLAAAINNFADAYRGGSRSDNAVAILTANAEERKVEAPKSETKATPVAKVAPIKTAAATQTTAASDKNASAAPPASADSSAAIDFKKQIQDPIVALATANGAARRSEAVAILASLGVKKASELTADQYPEAVRLIAEAG